GERWGLVERGQSASVFALEDASGRCLVDPEGAEVIASRRFHQQKGDFLYRGEYIAPGDELYLLGQLTTSGGYGDPEETRQEIGALVSTWKADRNFLLNQFDANRDGEIDLDEWQAVRAAATANVHARQRDYDLDPVSHRVGAPPGWLPYLLSDLPERRVAPRYRRWALVHLVLFLLAGALASWLAQRPAPLPEAATRALFLSAPAGTSIAVDGRQLQPNPLFNQGEGSLTTFTLRVPLGTRLLLAGYPDGRRVEYRLEVADERRQLLVVVPGEPGGRLTVH
ncbi:MAG TPA: EF-hand domain-containing protein, partial [Gammaproteobacteria bacterium]